MREIKFRAWDMVSRQMFYFEDMSECENVDGSLISAGLVDEPEGYEHLNDFDWMPLMQYTGLKDKNGKEIFEGDLVEEHFSHDPKVDGDREHDFPDDTEWDEDGNMVCKSVATFERGCFGLQDKDGFTPFSEIGIFVDSYKIAEIIGNIYENPELLTSN